MLFEFLMTASAQRVSILTEEQAASRNKHIEDQEAFDEYQKVVAETFAKHTSDEYLDLA